MADYFHFALLGMAVAFAGYYAGFLYLRYRHRARDYPPERQWPGHGIDVADISDRVHRVRDNYVAELQSRPHGLGRREGLLTLSRRAVGRLPYFRKRAAQKTVFTEPETHTSAA